MSMVRRIIWANIAVFLVQNVFHVWFRSHFVEEFFALSIKGLFSGFVWQVVTYSFLHENVFHILVNLLMVYFVGKIIEQERGGRFLLFVYLLGAK